MASSGDVPIALVGLMGAGKSAVARILGERLGAPVADLDARVEAACGATVRDVFERLGEASFRALEAEAFAAALADGARVIDGGGGLVLDPTCRRLLQTRCRTVWLDVSPAEAADRVTAEPERRPLLAGGGAEVTLTSLLRERAPLYEEVAWRRVETDGRPPADVADTVLRLMSEDR